MINRVLSNIIDNNMIEYGDKVIVGVSGGPDSMCLLHMLYNLKEKLGISIFVAHINHCLRPGDADEDEIYVKNFCASNGIEFYSKKYNVSKLAKDKGLSSETAAREVRYEYFNEIKDKLKANKIALAHNYNDQAETILMRIIRGTGIEGLKGIQAVRDGIYIRPVLILNRREIEDYCLKNDLRPRIDKSNEENIYNRNKIRLEMIPYIERNFNKDIISTLNRFSYMMSKENEFLDGITEGKYNFFCELEKEKIVIRKNLLDEHEVIVTRVIRKSIQSLIGSLNNIEMKHVYEIIELFKMGTGKSINLPKSIIAENVYGNVHIYIKNNNKEKSHPETDFFVNKYELEQNEVTYKCDEDITISFKVVDAEAFYTKTSNQYIRCFDFNEIRDSVICRFRKDGDVFSPAGMKGSKKLKSFFIDLKIPKEKRNKIPLICIDNEIVWIVGYRNSSKYNINEKTKKILIITVVKGETNK